MNGYKARGVTTNINTCALLFAGVHVMPMGAWGGWLQSTAGADGDTFKCLRGATLRRVTRTRWSQGLAASDVIPKRRKK